MDKESKKYPSGKEITKKNVQVMKIIKKQAGK